MGEDEISIERKTHRGTGVDESAKKEVVMVQASGNHDFIF